MYDNPESVKRVQEHLFSLNLDNSIIKLDETAASAKDAANSLKTSVGSIVKSIIFLDDRKQSYLFLISGINKFNNKSFHEANNISLIKPEASVVKEITGFSIGGVSPYGHLSNPYKVYIDPDLKKYPSIYASAGHPFYIFKTTFDELLLNTNAEVASYFEII